MWQTLNIEQLTVLDISSEKTQPIIWAGMMEMITQTIYSEDREIKIRWTW